jgi:hypothetical protein
MVARGFGICSNYNGRIFVAIYRFVVWYLLSAALRKVQDYTMEEERI